MLIVPSESGIYFITNVCTNKVYVGKATRIKRRIRHHIALLKARKHHCVAMQREFDQYGETAFSVRYELFPEAALSSQEQWFIDLLRSQRLAYNTVGVRRT